MKKILFLGYNNSRTKLIKFLNNIKNTKVHTSKNKLTLKKAKSYDLIILFGYRHIIPYNIVKKLRRKIINLHIGYLPYNRGAHPNFWSFIDMTPTGVTIHEIDGGIDTGKIIFRKLIDFELYKYRTKLTFRSTYKRLIMEIENLFIENHKSILSGEFKSYKQIGLGTFHQKNDLPSNLKSWDQNIFKTIKSYELEKKNYLQKKLNLISQIEKTRKNNNINWMNIVRNSLKLSPKKTLSLLKSINSDDQKISNYFRKLNEN